MRSFNKALCYLALSLFSVSQAKANPDQPQNPAVSQGWEVRSAPEVFTAKSGDAVWTFHQTDNASKVDPYVAQVIPFRRAYYRLHLRYRTDGHLAPTIILRAPKQDSRPLGILKLPPTKEWKDFSADVLGFDLKKPPAELHLYPGTLDQPRLKEDGFTPLGQHAGMVEFSDLTFEELPKPVGLLSKGPVKIKTSEEIYKTVGDLPLKIKIDQPEGLAAPVPAVIWFHGGGWGGGNPDSCILHTNYLSTRGIPCVRPQYRLISQGGNIDTTMEDVMDAVQWVRDNGLKYGIDPKRIILAGTSAGAHLGALAAQKAPDCVAFIGIAGIYDMVEKGDSCAGRNPDFLKGGKDPEIWKKASAMHQMRKPPVDVFLIHGGIDTILDPAQSVRFGEAIKAAGGRAEVVIVPELTHFPNQVQDEIFQKVEAFVREESRP